MLITVFDGLPSKVASETATVQKYTVMQKKENSPDSGKYYKDAHIRKLVPFFLPHGVYLPHLSRACHSGHGG